MNSAVLREISSLCDQLPVLDNKLFEKSFQDVILSSIVYMFNDLVSVMIANE